MPRKVYKSLVDAISLLGFPLYVLCATSNVTVATNGKNIYCQSDELIVEKLEIRSEYSARGGQRGVAWNSDLNLSKKLPRRGTFAGLLYPIYCCSEKIFIYFSTANSTHYRSGKTYFVL